MKDSDLYLKYENNGTQLYVGKYKLLDTNQFHMTSEDVSVIINILRKEITRIENRAVRRRKKDFDKRVGKI